MKTTIILALPLVATGAHASCVTDQAEMGDIGPSSELVCQELEQRFAGAALAVEGRLIHSPTEVTVTASADGQPILLGYRLTGFTWHVHDIGAGALNAGVQPATLSLGR